LALSEVAMSSLVRRVLVSMKWFESVEVYVEESKKEGEEVVAWMVYSSQKLALLFRCSSLGAVPLWLDYGYDAPCSVFTVENAESWRERCCSSSKRLRCFGCKFWTRRPAKIDKDLNRR
jgi:hypothetical protein